MSVIRKAVALCLGIALCLSACAPPLGQAQLAWEPPRPEGSAATRIAGYRVAWGANASGPFDLGEQQVSAATTSLVVRDLKPGTYCFVVYARADGGVESAPTAAVCKQVAQTPR